MLVYILFGMTACVDLSYQAACQNIHHLFRASDFEGIRDLLGKHPNLIKWQSEDGETALHTAIWRGNTQLVDYLLSAGANVNAQANTRSTPLHWAESEDIVRLLLAKKPKLEVYGAGYQSPLEAAAERVSRRYSNSGGDKSKKEKWQRIARMMIDAGAYYDIRSAIYLDDVERVKAILQAEPARVNDTRPELPANRKSAIVVPLRNAAGIGRVEICKLLLAAKADPNDFENYAGLPIICSCVMHADIVKLLIEAGADLKRPIKSQWFGRIVIFGNATALHYAIANRGTNETVQLLLKHGVAIDAQDGAGNSALHLATGLGHFKMAQFLVEKGAKVDAKNEAGKTPIKMINELTYYNGKPASDAEVKQMQEMLQKAVR